MQVFAQPDRHLWLPLTVASYKNRLVTTSWVFNAIQEYDQQTDSITAFHLDFAGPMNAIEYQGGLAVAEIGTGSVVRGDHSTIASGFAVPIGLAAAGNDLYVSDFVFGTLTKVSASGSSVVLSGLAAPEGLAIDRRGRVLISETGARRVLAWDPASNTTSVVVSDLDANIAAVPGAPSTWVFSGVAVDPLGLIYVSHPGGVLQLLGGF